MKTDGNNSSKPLDLLRELDDVADQFEKAWAPDCESLIEQFIKKYAHQLPGDRLLEELLRVDVEKQLQASGNPPLAKAYAKRFPDLDLDSIEYLIARTSSGSNFQSANELTIGVSVGSTDGPVNHPTGGDDYQTLVTDQQSTPIYDDELNRIGNYEVVCELARGGMGVVYKAVQMKLNRLVAVKMIRSGGFAGPEEVRRFLAEAEAVAKLDHRGIVPIYEIGEHQGQPFFSMAFIEGQNLAELVSDGPIPTVDAVDLMIKIAQAIGYANSNGVLHRDLKPANVLIDQNGEPHVTDFGLAKHIADDSSMTATGQILGTPSFMSPEQASGNASRVDQRSDVYSLGAILYNLTTGRPPFQAASPMQTLQQVVRDDAIRPTKLNSSIPKDVETICLKCLKKDPQRRYATADELAADLVRWQQNLPIFARPTRPTEKIAKWMHRHPVFVATTLVSSLILLILSFVFVWQIRSAVAKQLVDSLAMANTSEITPIIRDLEDYSTYARDDLQESFAMDDGESNEKLHAAIALLSSGDQSVLSYLKTKLVTVRPDQFNTVCSFVEPYSETFVDDYWQWADDPGRSTSERFQASCFLARFDYNNKKWDQPNRIDTLAKYLVGGQVEISQVVFWLDALAQLGNRLRTPLEAIYLDKDAPVGEKIFATDALRYHSQNDPEHLFELTLGGDSQQFSKIFKELRRFPDQAKTLANEEISKSSSSELPDKERERIAKRKCNAAVVLQRLDELDSFWPLFQESSDLQLRSYIVNYLSELGGEIQTLLSRYQAEQDVSAQRAILLCIGQFENTALSKEVKGRFSKVLLDDFATKKDAGLHAAIRWLLLRWGLDEDVLRLESEMRQLTAETRFSKADAAQWLINSQGHSFVVLDADTVRLGSPATEFGRDDGEFLHERIVGRQYVIGAHEVTRGSWSRFEKDVERVFLITNSQIQQSSPTDDCPQTGISWYDAAWYCNWLSELEKIPKDQWCYLPNDEGKYEEGMRPADNYWELDGYRLPTEAEWEFACRANSTWSRHYGSAPELLEEYAWFNMANAKNRTSPIGGLKPNDFGLFDMYGNAVEWCHERKLPYPEDQESALPDFKDLKVVNNLENRVMRGASFVYLNHQIRSAVRLFNHGPEYRGNGTGFRPVRTVRWKE